MVTKASKKKQGFTAHDHPPPEGKMRQSQAITTYGPGAMVDLVNDAVLMGGLEFWSLRGRKASPYAPGSRPAPVARKRTAWPC